jgi:hypothetical protein
MNEVKLGQTYFDVLNTIKDQIANNLVEVTRGENISPDVLRKLIYTAQATVESTGGNGLSAIIKSCK